MCANLRLQETGKLDQRTSTAVESLLSLRGNTPIAVDDGQWRPLSPASSVGADSATLSPTRTEPAEPSGYIEADQSSLPPPDTLPTSRETVRALNV